MASGLDIDLLIFLNLVFRKSCKLRCIDICCFFFLHFFFFLVLVKNNQLVSKICLFNAAVIEFKPIKVGYFFFPFRTELVHRFSVHHPAFLRSLYLYLSSHVSVYTSLLVTGAGELQQRENGFAVGSQNHGEPHRSGLEPRVHFHGCINNFSAADAYNPPPQEQ